MKSTITVAVIGTGHLGQIHARIYATLPQARLITLCDTDQQRVETLAKSYHCASTLDYRTITAATVKAVSIATPTITHAEIARYFLKRGIHVLVEKPLTPTIPEAAALIRLAEHHNCILQVGHVERFNPAVQTLQKLSRRPLFIECHRLNRFPQRGTDVSVVLDLMIHDIDIVSSLVNSPLQSCQAVGVSVLSKFPDIANARLVFKNGCVANLTASRVSDDSLRKIRIFESDAYFSTDYASQHIISYRKQSGDIEKIVVPVPKKEPLREELADFLQCITHCRQPLVRGHDAKQALHIAMAICRGIDRSNNKIELNTRP